MPATVTFTGLLDLRRRDRHIDWSALEQQIGADTMRQLEQDTRNALHEELSLHTQLTADNTLTVDGPRTLADVLAALDAVRNALADAYRVAYAYSGGSKEHGLVEEIDELAYELSGTVAHIDNGDYDA
ncbi:hypothetical protein ACWDBF_21345 [Streptomyces angustmyceticus]